MALTDTGLVLGRGTLLAAFTKSDRDKWERAASQIFQLNE
jgi:N-dimethylarginine dimethylaminohydrolase